MSSWYHDKGVWVNLHTPKVINVVKTICIRWNIYYDIQCANPKPAARSPHPNKAISMNNSLRDPPLIVHYWVANVPNASWQPQANCQQPFKRTEKAHGFVVVCCVWLYETDLWNKSANAGGTVMQEALSSEGCSGAQSREIKIFNHKDFNWLVISQTWLHDFMYMIT